LRGCCWVPFLNPCFPRLRRVSLFLASPRKSKQKEGDPGSAPASPVPCATRQAGRLRNSGLRPSDSPRRKPPASLRCSAPLRGTRKASGLKILSEKRNATVGPKKCPKSKKPSPATDGLPGPLGGAEQRRKAGGSRRGLFEGRSPEFRSRPAFRVAQGTPEGGADPGSPSSLLTFFLATQEESKTRLKRGKHKSRKGTQLQKQKLAFTAPSHQNA
jgi:hypothetical protein